MKLIIVACALCAIAGAAVIPEESTAQITEYESTNDGAGTYHFRYKTSNGITREESGQLVNIGKENEHMLVVGSYSYTDTDGKMVVSSYSADENGFHSDEQPPVTTDKFGSQGVSFAIPANIAATLLG